MSVFAISDLHGKLDLYKSVKDYISPTDIVYVLGDCGDRGPEPWETIKAVYNDPQFIYLKGNHEDMLVNAMQHAIRNPNHPYGANFNMLRRNGGEGTFKGWLAESSEDRFEWYRRLRDLPLCSDYENSSGVKIFLNHSGADENASDEEMLWDRDHFWYFTSEKYDLIVHGHTPSPLLHRDLKQFAKMVGKPFDLEWEVGAFWYCDERKVCLDNGSVWTNVTVLFNLDTFDEEIFGEFDDSAL